MTRPGRTAIALAMTLLTLAPFGSLTVSPAAAAPLLTLPIAGTTHGNGAFSGTLAVTSVVAQGADVFVEGIVTGTVTHSNKQPLGTILSVPVRLPLTGNWHQVAGLAPGLQPQIVLAQSTCSVLHLSIGAVDLDVLGVVVTTSPITLDVSGDSAGPLGSLVCTILNLVTTVTGLLNSLTSLLGTLGGTLGSAPGA